MGQESLQILIVMVVYMAAVIGIGIFFARRANADTEKFFLGGRSLGPWVSAMSAEASDMSGWLLMGLPGVAYWCGLADAPCRGNVYKLAGGIQAAQAIQHRREQRHNPAGVFLQSFS